MSGVTSDPEPTPEASPAPAQPGLPQLDDKHLTRYRHPNERWALLAIITGTAAFVAVLWAARPYLGDILGLLPDPLIRAIVHWLHPARVWIVLLALLALAWAMDVVGQSTRAWQLVARAVEVTPTTFPQLAPIVEELRARFDLPRTRVFVSRDAPLAGYTVGVREPFAIVFSSAGVASLTPDEFKFVLGREIGHIKLGHTLAATVLGSARMSLPQPFSSLLKIRKVLFGSFQHAQELSCDRIGVVATRDVRPALSTLIKQSFGVVRGARIDFATLAPQAAELRRGVGGATLRATQMLDAEPFAVARLAELVAWAGASLETPAPTSPTPGTGGGATVEAVPAASEAGVEAPGAARAAVAEPPVGAEAATAAPTTPPPPTRRGGTAP